MAGHRSLQDEFVADFKIPDPGASGTIRSDRHQGIVVLVTAAAETRIIALPTKPGLRLTLQMKTDGGTCTVTQAGSVAFNQAGHTSLPFDDEGDFVTLISVERTVGGSTVFHWRIEASNGVTSA